MVLRLVLTVVLLLLPPVVLRALGRPLTGSFLGVPYDYRLPTPGRLKQTVWNPTNDRLLVPHLYGWGYSLNVRAVARRLGLVER
jgi:hypothetical protein